MKMLRALHPGFVALVGPDPYVAQGDTAERHCQRNRSSMKQKPLNSPSFSSAQAGPGRESERFVVPQKPGNAGGGKGPQFKTSVESGDSQEIGDEPITSD